MDYKERAERIYSFSGIIVALAAEHGLTVSELRKAADIAKEMAENSKVEKEAARENSITLDDCLIKGLRARQMATGYNPLLF